MDPQARSGAHGGGGGSTSGGGDAASAAKGGGAEGWLGADQSTNPVVCSESLSSNRSAIGDTGSRTIGGGRSGGGA